MNTAHAEAGIAGGGRDTAFFVAAALVFGVSAALSVRDCASMPMPWMRMPGQTWPGAAAAFLGMWSTMMVAMMLPVLMPTLHRYRRALGPAGAARRERLTAAVGAGYFCVWSAVGVAVYPIGIALAAMLNRLPAMARGAPFAAGLVVVVAGTLQFTAWKSRQLACCRKDPRQEHEVALQAGPAFRYGIRCGLRCGGCCAGLTLILLVPGLMDLRLMALVMLAIATERLAPRGAAVARAIGVMAIIAGLILMVRS